MADPATYRPAPGQIPDSPGVYRFRDEHGRVVYVGKAKSLRSRLSSYFQDIAALHPGTRYFGPYAHAWAIRETVDLLLRVFPVRTCSAGVFKRAAQTGRPVRSGQH